MSKIKEKISTWYHSKTKKQLILGSIFMVALPIGAGVAAGLVINKFFIGKTADYSGLDATELSTDVNSVYQKYENCKAQGKEYSEVLKSYEMVNVAYKLFGDSEKCRSITIGNANAAIVDQSIRASSFKVGNEYLEESISKSSFVSLAARTYLHAD